MAAIPSFEEMQLIAKDKIEELEKEALEKNKAFMFSRHEKFEKEALEKTKKGADKTGDDTAA